jgi:hypothetical protein
VKVGFIMDGADEDGEEEEDEARSSEGFGFNTLHIVTLLQSK